MRPGLRAAAGRRRPRGARQAGHATDLARSARRRDLRGVAVAGTRLGWSLASLKVRLLLAGVAVAAVALLLVVALILALGALIGASGATGSPAVLAGATAEVETWSATALADIQPEWIRVLYEEAVASRCPTLPAMFVAAIGKVESNHGNHPLVRAGEANDAGARGVMQVLPGAWIRYGVDGDGDGRADPDDPADSIHTGVEILCAVWALVDSTRSRSSLWRLAYAYNHGPYTAHPPATEEAAVAECGGPGPHERGDPCYVAKVLDTYAAYREALLHPGGEVDPGQVPDPRVRAVIQYARDQVGKRYVWGARGPDTFDCSGLMQAAYRQIRLEIGWNTDDQFLNRRNRERNHLVAGSQGIRSIEGLRAILQPGDLIYIGVDDGSDGVTDHVVMYVGENSGYPTGDRRRYEIVHASNPTRGVVKDPLYLPRIVSGVLRPAASLPDRAPRGGGPVER